MEQDNLFSGVVYQWRAHKSSQEEYFLRVEPDLQLEKQPLTTKVLEFENINNKELSELSRLCDKYKGPEDWFLKKAKPILYDKLKSS